MEAEVLDLGMIKNCFACFLLSLTVVFAAAPKVSNQCAGTKVVGNSWNIPAVNKGEILALFDDWNNALKTGDPKKVSALYSSEAILLPTLSNRVRHNHAEIEDYFVHFLAKVPEGVINEANVRIHDSIAINSGVYTFTFANGTSARARFTFVYAWNGTAWEIIEHHSSQMPE